MSEAHGAPRVVQLSFLYDPQQREPEELLRAWPTLLGVAAGASRAGVHVTVVQAAARNQTIERDGVRIEFVNDSGAMPKRRRGIPVVRRPARLLDRVVSLSPDVVHVHGFGFPFAMRQLREALPRAAILVQDHGAQPPVGVRRLLWRWGYSVCDAVAFSTSEQLHAFVAAGVISRRQPVFDILEGSSRFTPGDRAQARRFTGMFGDPCILWSGYPGLNRDPLVVLDAFERVASSLPDARLWCGFGPAPLREQMERRIAGSATLRDRVMLLQARPFDEMERYFRAADLYVQMTHSEGCSYSTIDALACGVAPIVSDIPSTRRVVGDGGELVPVGDADALAAAIRDWAARDPETRRTAARTRFEQAASFDVIGRDLRHAYETLAARR